MPVAQKSFLEQSVLPNPAPAGLSHVRIRDTILAGPPQSAMTGGKNSSETLPLS